MGKKIGILTFHRAANFGAVLQAYALEQALSAVSNKVSVEIVDYKCKKIEGSYAVFNPNAGNILKEIVRLPFCAKKRLIKRKIFNKFLSDNLSLSKARYTKSSIATSDNEYSAFVAGSDQIWNDFLTDADLTYCLDFVQDYDKRFSFAASFGNCSKDANIQQKYNEQIAKFNKISVREEESKTRLDNTKRDDVFVSLDPTFLLNRPAWISFTRNEKKHDKKYVLLYELTPGKKLVEFAQKLAKEKGLELLVLSDSYSRFPGIKHVQGVGPIDFVSLIENAEYVVTNSFHGTAFSIIFNTDFYVETEAQKSTNHRIIYLLNTFEILGRDITHTHNIGNTIDWKHTNAIRDNLVANTMIYIKEIVEFAINH